MSAASRLRDIWIDVYPRVPECRMCRDTEVSFNLERGEGDELRGVISLCLS
jgi:hypothetical protein